jgi:uncharacterized membrane protein YgcG
VLHRTARSPLAALAGAVVALLLISAAPAAAERMLLFESGIYLGSEDVFTVEERIRWDFGTDRRHGIFREIQIRYPRGAGADFNLEVEVLTVTDADGASRPHRVSRSGRNLKLRIGDPDATVSGVQEYRIRYRVERALLFFEDHDELYWNVTGDQWAVAIGDARATVYPPTGVSDAGLGALCFTGRRGSTESACQHEWNGAAWKFRSTQQLAPGEGMTLVLGLPKGLIREPSDWERFWSRVSDYLSVWVLLPLLALAGMTTLWRREGRDRGASASIPVRYEPPEGMSPAELGTIVDEKVDIGDITSSILDLAVRGALRIEEIEGTKFLFLSDRDYRLVKLRELEDARPHEKLLMSRLFATGDSVHVSDLKQKFYEHLPEIKQTLYRVVSREGRFFPTAPDKVRQRWGVGGGVVAGAGGVLFALGFPSAGICLGLAGLTVLAFSPFMPRRTRRGRRAYEEIMGFKEFLSRVDRDRLERMGARTTEKFERVLPFAVVLGVADDWADAFADLYTQPPQWYVSDRYRGGFQPRHFVGDVGHSLDTLGQTMASRPQSSGSGSSGFGGGGFSGGGMGGGGGGSW